MDMDHTAQRIKSFFAQFPTKSYRAGETILMPHDNIDAIYYIESGEIQQYDIQNSGKHLVVNTYKAGSFIPLTAIFTKDGEQSMWFFDALTAVKVQVAPLQHTKKFIEEDSQVLLDFTRRLSSGAAGQQRKLLHIMSGKPKIRIMYELVILLKRFGVHDDQGITITITESQLAEQTGLSRETVNRELKALKQAKLITNKYRKVTAYSIAAIEELLEFEV